MAILPYCIFASDASAKLPSAGVRAAELRLASSDGLKAVYSEHAELGNGTQEDAVAFHNVIEGVFSQVALIPFRFPNLLGSTGKLAEHLHSNAGAYTEDLRRFRDLVQMELIISGPSNIEAANGRTPGTQYLKARSDDKHTLHAAAARTRELLGNSITDWRQTELTRHQRKGEVVRCFALVERAKLKNICDRVRDSASERTSITLSGPWPPTAFMRSMARGSA